MEPVQKPLRTSVYRTGVATFAVGVLVGMLASERIRPAEAQIPDPGSQRAEIRRETQRTNDLLAEILGVLRRDTLKVRVIETDKDKGNDVRTPPPTVPSNAEAGETGR